MMLIHHDVRDYSQWKRGYDEHLPKRTEAGLTERYVLHGIDDGNEVVMLFEAKDLGRAKAFADSPDLHEVMEKNGVIGKPDVYFLEN